MLGLPTLESNGGGLAAAAAGERVAAEAMGAKTRRRPINSIELL